MDITVAIPTTTTTTLYKYNTNFNESFYRYTYIIDKENSTLEKKYLEKICVIYYRCQLIGKKTRLEKKTIYN
jgi:hypothetical protein